MNRWLTERSGSLVVIESHCFDVDTQWTDGWKNWLKELGTQHRIKIEYYVLTKGPVPDQDIERLRKMDKHLRSSKLTLRVCDKRVVDDILGAAMAPQFDSLEIMGDRVLRVKFLTEEDGKRGWDPAFVGGRLVDLRLADLTKEDRIATVFRTIKEHAGKLTPTAIKKLIGGK